MKRSLFTDAIIFATLTGLCLSSLIGCAGASARTVHEQMKLHRPPVADFSAETGHSASNFTNPN